MVGELKVSYSSFKEVLPIWTDLLWPQRVSEIQEKSCLKLGGGVDLSIFNGPQAQFWKVEKDQKIVAVNSGFWTDDRQYRSRGLYVLKEHRGLGLAKKLLEHAVEFAASEKAELIWSMPRVSVLKVYQSVGFHQIGSEFIDGVEFGPNVFAIRNL